MGLTEDTHPILSWDNDDAGKPVNINLEIVCH